VQTVYDYRLSLLEQQINQLRAEYNEAFAKRQLVVKEIEANSNKPIDKLPLQYIASFLKPKDLCSLASLCSRFRSELVKTGLIVPNLVIPNGTISASVMCRLSKRLCYYSVINLQLDARLSSNCHLLYFLSQNASRMQNLKSFCLTGHTVNDDLQLSLLTFFENLPPNTLQRLHLSGIRKLETLGKVIKSQAGSLLTLRIDYLATDHGTDVTADIMPVMPNIEFLWFDVADLSEAPVSLMLDVLSSIKHKEKLRTLYIPHVELLGDQDSFRPLLKTLMQFTGLNQCVLRFHGFYVPLEDIYELRNAFSHLPAFNISRNFVIAMKRWAPWWPKIADVWPASEYITGRAVFKEQIEFASMGCSADREWLRLSREEKDLWNQVVAPQVRKLF